MKQSRNGYDDDDDDVKDIFKRKSCFKDNNKSLISYPLENCFHTGTGNQLMSKNSKSQFFWKYRISDRLGEMFPNSFLSKVTVQLEYKKCFNSSLIKASFFIAGKLKTRCYPPTNQKSFSKLKSNTTFHSIFAHCNLLSLHWSFTICDESLALNSFVFFCKAVQLMLQSQQHCHFFRFQNTGWD